MASQKSKEYVRVRGHAIETIPMYWTSNGTTTVITTVKGVGYGVVRTNTGIFTVTLSSTYAGFVGMCAPDLMSATILANPTQIVSSSYTNGAFTVTNFSNTSSGSTATAQEVASGVGVSMVVFMYNSSLTV